MKVRSWYDPACAWVFKKKLCFLTSKVVVLSLWNCYCTWVYTYGILHVYTYICTWSIYIYLVDELLAVNDCERNHNRFVRVCKPEFLSSKFGGFAAIPAVFPTKFSSFNPKVDLRFSEQILMQIPNFLFWKLFQFFQVKLLVRNLNIFQIILKKNIATLGTFQNSQVWILSLSIKNWMGQKNPNAYILRFTVRVRGFWILLEIFQEDSFIGSSTSHRYPVIWKRILGFTKKQLLI